MIDDTLNDEIEKSDHRDHGGHGGHRELPAGMRETTGAIIDAGLTVHRTLGPGLLESIYEVCLERELQLRGVSVKRQVGLPIFYEGIKLYAGYRLDFVVEDSVVLEIKAVDSLTRLHEAQVLTYLKLSSLRVGLLMNFNVELFKNGLKRLVL